LAAGAYADTSGLHAEGDDRLVEAGYEVIHVVWAELWTEPALRSRIDRALQRSRLRAAS
jgi:hypothetical protein